MNNPKHNPLSPVHDPANAKAKYIEDAKMKNDVTSPARAQIKPKTGYKIEVDITDGKYKIFKYERGVRFAVGEFYKLCDREARDVRERMK